MEERINPNFAVEVYSESGTDVRACYQCLKCSGGCPVAEEMDYPPSQIMRFVQLGMEDRALKSNTCWICASCQTCGVRCPNDIDIPHVMDILKQQAIRKGIPIPEKALAVFHQSFLNSIKLFGRVFEMHMIGEHKTRTGDFFSDLGLGGQMFIRNKLKFAPQMIKGTKEVREMFKTAKERSPKL